MSKKKKAKKLDKIKAAPSRYVSEEQKTAVKAIVTFLLELSKEQNYDCVSQQTLRLAFDKYVDLVDADETPGTSVLCRLSNDAWDKE